MSPNLARQGYRIGAAHLATAFDGARELTAMPHVTRLPCVPHWVRGLANHHGHPLPVFDIAPLLGLAHDATSPAMLLVVGEGDELAGLVIDGPARRLDLDSAGVISPPPLPPALEGHVARAFRERGAGTDAPVWLEFDPAGFLGRLAEVIGSRESWTL